MNEELEKFLVDKYPSIYRDYGGDIRKTCMGWGFTCGDGWFNLIDDLSFKIKQIDKKNRVVADQVKEKFGGLRFYYHIEDYKEFQLIPMSLRVKIHFKIIRAVTKIRKLFYKTFLEKVDDLVYEAEKNSYKICEICGCPGEVARDGWWVTTRCVNCKKLHQDSKSEEVKK